MLQRLSVVVAVVALGVGGAPLAVGAAPQHMPKKHGSGSGGGGSSGKPGKHQKNCHNLPCW